MSSKSTNKTVDGNKVPVDVRITNVSDIPAHYFLHTEVIVALRSVIRSDVVVYGKPVPPGAQAVFGSKTDIKTQTALLKANSALLAQQVRAILPAMVALAFIVGVAVTAIALIGGLLNG